MSITKIQEAPSLYKRRQHFPGYIDVDSTNGRAPLSSNNPFRSSLSGSDSPSVRIATSPFDEDEVDQFYQQQRSLSQDKGRLTPGNGKSRFISIQHQGYSLSDRDLTRPTSVYSTSTSGQSRKTRDSVYFSPVNSAPSNQGSFSRRTYNPPTKAASVRKSTNPFIDEDFELSEASNKPTGPYLSSTGSRHHSYDDVSDRQVVYSSRTQVRQPIERRSNTKKPQIVRRSSSPNSIDSTSSGTVTIVQKPKSKSTHRRRANSDSSIMDPPPPSYRETAGSRGDHSSRDRDRSSRSKHGDKGHTRGSDEKRRDHKESDGDKRRSSKKKASVGLDVIDKLDVTGFYGPGRFHHDGPFDACNPHRNKNTKAAPVAAYSANGPNNSMAGGGSNSATESRIMGRNTDEAYLDYNTWGAKKDSNVFDSSLKAQPVHGDTTMGLGSSTFLDGAPASQAAIKGIEESNGASGLGRKKSLVQRLRGNSNTGGQVPPRVRLEVPNYEPISRSSSNPEPNSPNFSKPDAIPRVTIDANESSGNRAASRSSANGLLRRVKSLKVGRPKN